MANLYYRSDIVFLYVKFLDENNLPVNNVIDPKIRILHKKMDKIYEDLSWTSLQKLKNNEYYYNFKIPDNSDFGTYDVIYKGTINNKDATILENFYVIQKNDDCDIIKVYGYINDNNDIPIVDANIQISNKDGLYNTNSYSHENGYWETYVYPGEYYCIFSKDGYQDININFEIGNELPEMQFNNINMESIINESNRKGIYEIKDTCIMKDGIPLDGLKIDVFDILDINNLLVTTFTDKNGEWKVYLDAGNYFIKIYGNSMNLDFDKTFRLKVYDNGKYDLNNIDDNTAIANVDDELNYGNGDILYEDYIFDAYNNPIMDVQVTAYMNGIAIAENYTDVNGKWFLKLNKGKYLIKIYHPSFKQFPDFNLTIN